jgi:hypothetical protein
MHPPGPPPTWLIGNLKTIIKVGYPKALQQWAQQYGPVFKVGMSCRYVCCMYLTGMLRIMLACHDGACHHGMLDTLTACSAF